MLKLWGLADNPNVRRVAVALAHWRLSCERLPLSALGEGEALRRIVPTGRAPVLALADGRLLTDSRAMLEWLDEEAPPDLRLTPATDGARLDMLEIEAVALDATDGALSLSSERLGRTVPDLARISRCEDRVAAALDWIEPRAGRGPLAGERLSRADLAVACLSTYIATTWPRLWGARRRLIAHRAWAEAMPPFLAVPAPGTGNEAAEG